MTTTEYEPRLTATADGATTSPSPIVAPTTASTSATTVTGATEHAVLDVVVPVHNEQRDLVPSVERLHAYLATALPFPARITIADNASTDATWSLATDLAERLPGLRAVRLEQKGRGRALAQVWSTSDADVLAYMDVDLSTDLAALLPLVAPLVSGHSDLAIGTRLARGSRVVRGPKRELISRGYNLLLRTALAARFSDAQCGFKAIRADRARELLPLVEDTGWFFDTELLVLAERRGLRIHEVPVDWVDDPDSSVDIVATATADLKGMWRLARGMATGRIPVSALPAQEHPGVPRGLGSQLLRFAAIGVASTLAYLALFLLLRGALGAQGANLAALLLTAVANTAANRRLTFGVRGAADRFRHQLQGLVVFAIGLGLTSASLAVLGAVAPGASRGVEVAVLIGASVAATLVRFLLFRSWVFPRRHHAPAVTAAPDTRNPR
ncbi:MAG TPA: glycosyltransferase [Candidatus Nanopelagicales bacterium]|nr:glycosyltransferase [Candidatus Nanopelagicales bacterium]